MTGHLIAVIIMQGALCAMARLLKQHLEKPVLLAGLILPHVVVSPWLFSDRTLLPTIIVERTFPGIPWTGSDTRHVALNDAVSQFAPWESEVRRGFQGGRFPLWSDRIDGGSSLWSNPQSQVLSPAKMLARLVAIDQSFVTVMVLTIMIALDGAWLAARLLGVGRAPSLLVTCGFALGGGVMSWSVLPNSSTVAWAPWLIASVLRLVREQQLRFLTASSVFTAALAFSGHPETAAASGILATICGLSLGRRGSRLKGTIVAAFAALLGLGLAAPIVIPFVHTMFNASRMDDTTVRPSPQKEVMLTDPHTWFVGETPKIFSVLANPEALGTPFVDPPPPPVPWPVAGGLYSGIAIFAGLLVSTFHFRRRMIPLILFASFGSLLSARLIIVERLLIGIPFVRYLVVDRVLPVVALCLCLIGGIGFEKLINTRPHIRSYFTAAIAAGLSIFLQPSRTFVVLWALLGLGILLSRWHRTMGLLIVVFVTLSDLVPWARAMLPVGERELFFPATNVTNAMLRETSEDGPWRVVGAGTAFYPSSLAMHELEDIRHHNPLAPRAYVRVLAAAFGFHARREYFSAFLLHDHPLLDFLNVRVAAIREPDRVPTGFRRLGPPIDGVTLVRNPNALRRFFIAPSAEIVPRDRVEAAVNEMKDARRVVLADQDLGGWRAQERPWMPRAVQVVSYRSGKYDLVLPEAGEKLLATSLLGPAGWTAVSLDRPLRTLAVNGAFLGVVVPAGTGEVSLRFSPPGFYVGWIVFALSILTIGAMSVLPHSRIKSPTAV